MNFTPKTVPYLENRFANINSMIQDNENSEFNRMHNKALGTVARFETENAVAGEGSLASKLVPAGVENGKISVVKNYTWTVSNLNRDDVPYVRLIEYRCNDSQIKKQYDFYAKLIPQVGAAAVGADAKKTDILDLYKEIFPKNEPTNFSYWLPYFNKTGFDLSTPAWQQLDSIGESLKGSANATSSALRNFGTKGKAAAGVIDGLVGGADFLAKGAETAAMANYPTVGVFDRPRIFAGHDSRTLTISFPLYNTVNEWDWAKNRDLIYLLMSQNLFNKRDYITGVPPVFYDVYVPGQYYSYASSITNINVENLGNVRLIDDAYIIPDAYQITLTLSEMATPSKNQFEAITSGHAAKFVNSSTIAADAAAEQAKKRDKQAAINQGRLAIQQQNTNNQRPAFNAGQMTQQSLNMMGMGRFF